jgi:MFS family permease
VTTQPLTAGQALRQWRNAVVVLFALGGITVSAWGPRLPSIRADLHLGDGVIGLVLAGVTVGSIAGLAASSALLSWLGARRVIASVVILASIGLATVGIAAGAFGSVVFTVVGFVFVGFGIGCLDVMINVQGSAVERESRKTLMPLMHAGWSVGAVVGSGIGAAAAALDVAFEWQFVGEAVVLAIAALVAVRFLPAIVVQDASLVRAPVGVRIRGWLRGWTDWRLLLIGVVMLGVELGEGTANSWLTLAVRDDHHQTDAVAALFFTAFAIGESGARILGGPLVDRVGRVNAVRFTTAIGVIGLVLFIVGAPAWITLIGVLLWSVGVSMGFPLGMSAAADSGPNPAARVSVVASIGYLANLGGPPVIGFLAESVGLLNAFWLVAVLLAVGFAVAGVLRPRATPKLTEMA